jgi:hypothetical protein
VQADFLARRWKEMVGADPAKAEQQPYKAVLGNYRAWLSSLLDHVPDPVTRVGEAYEGIRMRTVSSSWSGWLTSLP